MKRLEDRGSVDIEPAARQLLRPGIWRTTMKDEDRAQYRVTVMARRKGTTDPVLRVEGELRTIIYR